MAVETAPEETGEDTAEGRHISKYAKVRASLKAMYEIGAMPEREYKRNLKSIKRAEDRELARTAARQAAKRLPFTADELDEALRDLDQDVTLTQWKKTVAPIVYEMSRTYKRTHNSIKHFAQTMREKTGAGAGTGTEAPPRRYGPRRAASGPVLEQRRAAAAKARAARKRNLEARRAAAEKEAASG